MNTKQFNGHTPGPWHTRALDPNTQTEWAAVTSTGDWILRVAEDNKGWPLSQADARLIAAAPELLDLLKDARRMVQELHALLDGADGDEAYEWALRNIGEREMAWWRTYYVRRS